MREDCCNSEEAASTTRVMRVQQPDGEQLNWGCPACHDVGKSVQGQTVKAMLAVSQRKIGDVSYRFCRTPACSVVYYADDGSKTFTTEQVREPVFQKESTDLEVFVCYCFRRTFRDIVSSGAEVKTTILHGITRGIQTGQCACDLRNPQGACCLGNVRVLAKQSTRAWTSESN